MADLRKQLESKSCLVKESDVNRWNLNYQKTNNLEELIERMKRESDGFDKGQIIIDIQKINALILNLAPKSDLQDLRNEVQLNTSIVSNIDHAMKKFEPKFEDFEIKLDSFSSFTRLEFGKHHERADKID